MACAGSVSPATADITVANVKDGETLRYPVALLRGTANSGNSLKVVNRDNVRPDGTNEVEVVRHRFVALVELVPGENRLTLTAGDESQRLSLHFRPMTTPYQLNVVYVTASDGDSRYITQRSDDRQNFRERLDTAAKLMQTFTAEALAEQGFGRKTFKLDLDEQGKVRVHVVRHPLSRDEFQADGFDLYGTLYGWIDGQFSMSVNKNMVIMAFTEKTPEGQLKAHTAWAGVGWGCSVRVVCSLGRRACKMSAEPSRIPPPLTRVKFTMTAWTAASFGDWRPRRSARRYTRWDTRWICRTVRTRSASCCEDSTSSIDGFASWNRHRNSSSSPIHFATMRSRTSHHFSPHSWPIIGGFSRMPSTPPRAQRRGFASTDPRVSSYLKRL